MNIRDGQGACLAKGEYIDYFRDFFGTMSGTTMTPRTYGIEASYHFD